MLHLGDHNVSGGVRPYRKGEAYADMKEEIVEFFLREDIPDLIRAVDRQFGEETYSLRFLFRDEQHKITRVLLASALQEAAALYRSFNRVTWTTGAFSDGYRRSCAQPVPHGY